MHTTAFPTEDREVNDSDIDNELDDPNNYGKIIQKINVMIQDKHIKQSGLIEDEVQIDNQLFTPYEPSMTTRPDEPSTLTTPVELSMSMTSDGLDISITSDEQSISMTSDKPSDSTIPDEPSITTTSIDDSPTG